MDAWAHHPVNLVVLVWEGTWTHIFLKTVYFDVSKVYRKSSYMLFTPDSPTLSILPCFLDTFLAGISLQ